MVGGLGVHGILMVGRERRKGWMACWLVNEWMMRFGMLTAWYIYQVVSEGIFGGIGTC